MTVDSAERSLLIRRLTSQRNHVINQLDGLTDDQLRRPVLPSGWSCLGLVRHLTISDERYWFGVVVAGEPLDFWPEGENGDWRVGAHEEANSVVEAYRSAIARSDEIIDARGLDDARPNRRTGGSPPASPSRTCAPCSCTCWSRQLPMPASWMLSAS